MKKILFVATVDSHIRSFHLPYLKMMHDKGWEVHVATNGKEEFPCCDKKHTIRMERSPFKPNNLKAIKQMKKLLKKEHFDIIHCHTPMGSVVTRMAAKEARKNGTRVIYTAHGFHFYTGAPLINWLLFYPVEKYLAKYTDTIVTINKEDYNRAKKKFSKRCHDIQYVHGVGIDPKKFDFKMTAKEKHDLRASLGLKDDDFVMIFPARLDKNKNQGFLIKCMPELIKENPKIHLLLPGQDELNGEYQKLAARLNVDNNVHFLGIRNDIPKLLKVSNIAVSSSKREGLPVNIIEAIYSHKYIVAANCRGIKDIIKTEENGSIITSSKDYISEITKQMNTPTNVESHLRHLQNFAMSRVKNEVCSIYFNKHIEPHGKKITILHVLTKMDRAGTETMLMNIFRHIDKNKFSFIFAVSSNEVGAYDKEILESQGKIVHYPRYKIINHFKYKKWWNTYLSQHEINIIHGHIGSTAAIYLKIAKKFNIVTIAHSHSANNTITLKSIMYRLYSYRTRYISDYFLGCSTEALIKRYGKKVACDHTRSHLLKNAIDLNNYHPSKKLIDSTKRQLNLNSPLVIGTIGRLSDEKNPFFIIEILRALKHQNIDYEFIWVGDGVLKEALKEKIIDYNLTDNVKMLGSRDDVPAILSVLDIFILPSKYEGIPVVGIEAQAIGVPIICGLNISKDLRINNNIMYLSIDDPQKWAEEIVKQKGSFDKNCKDNIKKSGYDIEDTTKKLSRFYEKILTGTK